MFYPTKWDWATLVGVFGLFGTLFYLFVRFLPQISIVEIRSLVHETTLRSTNLRVSVRRHRWHKYSIAART